MYFVLIMQKVQTGLVIEFYSNSCLVRTDKTDIPCIGIKDIIVGDIVKIEILQDSKETKGVILSREDRKSLLQKKDGIKYKNIAANLSHVGILVTPKPKTLGPTFLLAIVPVPDRLRVSDPTKFVCVDKSEAIAFVVASYKRVPLTLTIRLFTVKLCVPPVRV